MWARVALALGCFLLQPQIRVSAAPAEAFTEISASAKLRFQHISPHTSRKYLIETMGSGVAFFDFDNDGRLDIFFVNGAPLADPTPNGTIPAKSGPKYWNRLYHQKKDGTFEDVTEHAGLQGVGYGMGVAVGDYDNDGFEDLYVTAYGGNRLYHNNGDGTFTDVTDRPDRWPSARQAAGPPAPPGSISITMACSTSSSSATSSGTSTTSGAASTAKATAPTATPISSTPSPPLVFHNDGNGHFTEVAAKIGLDVPGKGLGIAIADFDRDGHIDLAVANDSMPEFLYRNKGDGTFEETGLTAEIAVDRDGRTYAGMGIDFRRLQQRRPSRPRDHRPRQPEVRPLPQQRRRLLHLRHLHPPASAASPSSTPAGASASSTTTTTAGRTSSSPRATTSTPSN